MLRLLVEQNRTFHIKEQSQIRWFNVLISNEIKLRPNGVILEFSASREKKWSCTNMSPELLFKIRCLFLIICNEIKWRPNGDIFCFSDFSPEGKDPNNIMYLICFWWDLNYVSNCAQIPKSSIKVSSMMTNTSVFILNRNNTKKI